MVFKSSPRRNCYCYAWFLSRRLGIQAESQSWCRGLRALHVYGIQSRWLGVIGVVFPPSRRRTSQIDSAHGEQRACHRIVQAEKRHDAELRAGEPKESRGRNNGSSESRSYTSPSDPICAARRFRGREGGFREREEGEEDGGTWNPHQGRGASVQLRPHLGPAAPIPPAASNLVHPHLHPGARRLVHLLLHPPLRLLILPVCLQCTHLFLSLPLLYCLCLVILDTDILCSTVLPAVEGKQHWLLCSTAHII